MVTLERLHAEHADALLAFERENRAYFARTVPDRGDAFFTPTGFAARLASLRAEQEAGVCHFHVVLDEEGRLIGRINLIDVTNGSAELGYRVAESATGRGVATAAVAQMCRLAWTSYGLTSLTAVTTLDNPASMKVLTRSGFIRVRDTVVGGRPGVGYLRFLGAPSPHEAHTSAAS
ncbi:GNAT family N-acetyltransferase [Streptomyces sp. 15-116A]|uniref:GNAT family N-acetyltransferase n=1 Tax=Streptomyces sp. 15-116A TaxID=2259035 RepID=UPI0021B20B01|nr:GNAT family N-acetyltransferase [Streptomyces sp. 15-116A]MCT7353999.1 GNAT family N-acetyltransferase [Streptomyces sp. 15-116A]